ncbi:MAG: dynamin family protein [Pseudomonadota bacterium]
MYREDFIKALRFELLNMVEQHLSPISKRCAYSDVPLETNIRWRPLVLVIGNYSSGKSALINEFLGADIQATGQAPTDDSFTILTHGEANAADSRIQVIEERDGNYLINDPEYPFQNFKKHGQRFSSHFRLKKVNSPILENFAIIDTPGMLDSIAEKDRGYDYQQVIGDFAQIADLIIVLFDAHKAGTIRETHISLRDTLPAHTYEDRVLFALSRIDECSSLMDLVRVYGTLCWNLSQITGRKDIPLIRLIYSPSAASRSREQNNIPEADYLRYLENQREDLKKAVLEAPRHRLDNLATFVEIHSERLCLYLQALIGYGLKRRRFLIRQFFIGLLPSLTGAAAIMSLLLNFGLLGWLPPTILLGIGGGIAVLFQIIWLSTFSRLFAGRFHRKQLEQIDDLVFLENQHQKDTWSAVRDLARQYLRKTEGKFSLRSIEEDHAAVKTILDHGTREIREALNELSAIRPGQWLDDPPGPFLSALAKEMAGQDYLP